MTRPHPAPRPPPSDAQKARATDWFAALRDRITAAFEAVEDEAAGLAAYGDGAPGRFVGTPWQRAGGGGGELAVMRGRVFEKVGVNVSSVHGVFDEPFRQRIPGAAGDGRFWASGISLVAHLANPRVPAVHMNTRMIATTQGWFGGGTDLTPMVPVAEDIAHFHGVLPAVCDAHGPADYPRFKAWCDEYFYLKHRDEPRGAGGIFFDDLATDDWEADFAFTRAVGEGFLDAYLPILRRRMAESWSEQERRHQLVRRGRYVEFNLLYDRGTVFGLNTGGNVEAILMSLPPMVSWP